MNNKKTTVNITANNHMKIQQIQQKTGLTQTEIINDAIANVPIICLGNQQSIAEIFFEIKKLLSTHDGTNITKEVDKACQLLNLLMQKLEEAMRSKEE